MPTAPSIPDTCPHERRPGLTVCLHCRHAAREAEAERRRRTMSRAGVVVGVVVIGITIGHAALRAPEGTALAAALARVTASGSEAGPTLAAAEPDGGAAGPAVTPAPPAPAAPAPASATSIDSAAGGPATSAADSVGRDALLASARDSSSVSPAADSVAVAPAAPLAVAAGTAAPPAPLVTQGRSELPEGMHVVRGGDTLTVHFDTELGRTRRPEKFERIVRATLPAVYGPRAGAALAALQEGEIARSGDLLTELPARGVRIPSSDGWTIVVRPGTRPGRDGPIVVRYVATVAR